MRYFAVYIPRLTRLNIFLWVRSASASLILESGGNRPY